MLWVSIFIVMLLVYLFSGKANSDAGHKPKAALPRDSQSREEVMLIDDPRVPEAVRVHGLCFRPPAHFVTDLGNGEYVLSAEGGACLDLIYLK